MQPIHAPGEPIRFVGCQRLQAISRAAAGTGSRRWRHTEQLMESFSAITENVVSAPQFRPTAKAAAWTG
ncbi:hypothetical protein BZL30_9293 [Mycobacterium kansasii]|uniref:Uncharacterized protein n=1 Tax=Mycobacterium kansasii TaxID=1768 RepID=A0A1V3WB60_MYCKA|nr:hypothetical protein BZL30_9293 [Mycobacterium kansasii]